MKKLFSKTNILVLIIIVLVVFNIAVVATIIWHQYRFYKRFGEWGPRRMHRMELFIPQKLNFSPEQTEQFKKLDSAFRQSSF